jgi:hypothetical protein
MEVWLAHHGRAGLTPGDRAFLAPRFEKLSRDAASVASLSLDLVGEFRKLKAWGVARFYRIGA